MFSNHVFITLLIFVVTYVIIISERIHRTSIALLGAGLLLMFNVISQEAAINAIDFDTIGILIGTMIIVNIMKRSGIFGYMAIKAAKAVQGEPWKIIIVFSIITAIASAFLNNVTTILLIAPIALVIADTLELQPIPFVLPMVLASNIGGTATLIGDPPNIMIGSATNHGFMDFIVNLGPVVLVIFMVTIFIFFLMYRKSLIITDERKHRIMEMDENLAIKDMVLLRKSVIVLSLTILGFIIHESIHLGSASVAIIGAAILLVISKADPEEVLLEIEWPTIFFISGLFVLVGGLESVGVIEVLANKMLNFTNGNLLLMVILILWGSAIASAFLDNIPFVATMIPLIKSMTTLSAINATPLWWALALGACLGGNGTVIGASANVIVSGMLEKHGEKLGFMKFFKVGFPMMIMSIVISTIYLVIFYV